MDDSLLDQIFISRNNLVHYIDCVTLGQFLLLPDVFVQIAMGAILQDKIVKIGSFDDLIQS